MNMELMKRIIIALDKLGYFHTDNTWYYIGRYDYESDTMRMTSKFNNLDVVMSSSEIQTVMTDVLTLMRNDDLMVEFILSNDDHMKQLYEFVTMESLSVINSIAKTISYLLQASNKIEFSGYNDRINGFELVIYEAVKASGDELALDMLEIMLTGNKRSLNVSGFIDYDSMRRSISNWSNAKLMDRVIARMRELKAQKGDDFTLGNLEKREIH